MFEAMNRKLVHLWTLGFAMALGACGHPLMIDGKGDIVSASGTRNCSFEEQPCENLVVDAYLETYSAIPREGYEFIGWENCEDQFPQCSFDVDQETVEENWGEVMPALTAVFEPLDMPSAVTNPEVTAFESGHVRPLAMNADSTKLYAVNTPDNALEIFDITDDGLVWNSSIPVGLEPVAIAVHNSGDIWVVNHVSDSISIIDGASVTPSVTRTLLVGDEPRDIVFAGPGVNRAFITTAHRGQNSPVDPELLTEGVGRSDVWVFDTLDLGDALSGTPLTIVNMFADTPRALAVSNDGEQVYVATFNSGNQTTTINAAVRMGGLDKPTPTMNIEEVEQPDTGLIVKYNGANWMGPGDPITDTAPRDWSGRVRFDLPDYDIFEIDASAATPTVLDQVSGVGTILFNMAVHPVSGRLYVSNTDARNDIRFEGESAAGTTVRGNFIRTQISILDRVSVTKRNLNKHIASYDDDHGTLTERRLSVSQILQMEFSSDGIWVYGAAFGNSKIVKYGAAKLEDDSFTHKFSHQALVTGGGPTGLAVDEARGKIYVLTRFDNGISTVDIEDFIETDHILMHNPESSLIVEGRPFLYDAFLTSSRGDSSCASCHIFGDMDHLAWDLGNPDGLVVENTRDYALDFENKVRDLHPMKGPMTTQSFRGMKGNGPMHWRGDRQGTSRDNDETLEEQAFEDFNVAFPGLLGKETPLSDADMDKFAKFSLELAYPPNPLRALDNSRTPGQVNGLDVFMNDLTTGGGNLTCNQCHTFDPLNNHFATSGLMSVEGGGVSEDFKIPHLRSIYQKVGMFGTIVETGPQIRGFGYLHDGSVDTIDTYLAENNGAGFIFDTPQDKLDVMDFVFTLDSELAPIVGQQVTINTENVTNSTVTDRLDLLVARAEVTTPREECDLVFSGRIGDVVQGAFKLSNGMFAMDSQSDVQLTLSELTALAGAGGNNGTFTCVMPGQGQRIGIDRDADGVLNRDE